MNTQITGKGTKSEPFFIGQFTAPGLVNGIFVCLEQTFGSKNWGIQEWSHSFDGKTSVLKIAILRRGADSLYFYVSFWDPIDWRECTPQARAGYVARIMSFLIDQKGAKDLQQGFKNKTTAVGIIAFVILILLVWLFRK
jgi:hypothetical protein